MSYPILVRSVTVQGSVTSSPSILKVPDIGLEPSAGVNSVIAGMLLTIVFIPIINWPNSPYAKNSAPAKLTNTPLMIPAIKSFLPFAVKTIDTISRTVPTRNAMPLTIVITE